jgi:hypothetical protein
MARSTRVLTGILPALLLVLDGLPSFAAAELRTPARRGAIIALVPADHLAAPLPGAVPDEPRGTDPADFALMAAPLRHGKAVRVSDTAGAPPASPERTWLQLHRRRAPSPDDPDPY